MSVRMDCRVQVNPLERAPAPDSIPVSDCFTDGFFTLYAITPDFTRNDFPGSGYFMIASNRRERTAGNVVWSLQNHRTSAALAKELLYMVWRTIKVVLRASAFQAFVFGLVNVHSLFNDCECSPFLASVALLHVVIYVPAEREPEFVNEVAVVTALIRPAVTFSHPMGDGHFLIGRRAVEFLVGPEVGKQFSNTSECFVEARWHMGLSLLRCGGGVNDASFGFAKRPASKGQFPNTGFEIYARFLNLMARLSLPEP